MANENREELVELNYDGRNLTELPIYDEKWSVANIISIRDNNIEKINTFDLPSKLMIFDIGNNPLKTIVGTFPPTLQVLDLTNTKIDKLPEIDTSLGGLELLDIRYTPLGEKDYSLSSHSLSKREIIELYRKEEPPTREIEWIVQEYQKGLFNEEDSVQPYVKVVSSETFDEIKNELVSQVEDSDAICRRLVSKDYILGKIESCTYFIRETLGSELLALCIFKIKPYSIYIDVICSAASNKGGGSRIIDILMNYTKNHHNIQRIDLDSVFDSIGFYEKKGFKKCPETALCPMTYIKSAAGGRRTRKLRGTLTLFLRKRSKKTRRH